jgi:DeoR family glycerol-3-phosphate regulon repressor
MRANERQQRILEFLRNQERVSVAELAEKYAASQETIRRDLTALADRGLVNKYHGGASLSMVSEDENAFLARMHEHVNEKKMIACQAARLFSPGDSIFIDTGTTTLFFARALSSVSRLTVVTNSLQIARAVGRSGSRVFMIGGEYHPDAEENLGALALEQVSRFNADHAVITVGALSTDGAMDFSIEEAEMARAMVKQARYLTVIADSSKLGKRAMFQIFPLSRIDRLVINRLPTGPLMEALKEAQVEIIAPSANYSE